MKWYPFVKTNRDCELTYGKLSSGGIKMEKPTVYFTDFRCPVGTSRLDKLKKLCIAAGIKDIDMDGKFVAIKMHFGELGNLAFLRPNYAKVVADLCKEQGGCRF